MKPSKLLRWVVMGSVGALVACGGGVSSIGKGGGADGGEGGSGASASKGGSASGPSGKGGTMATGGGVGTGASPSVELCQRDTDCTPYDLPCQVCPDGSRSCAEMVCDSGKCTPSTPGCGAECQNDMDCPVPDIACAKCDDGTSVCPTSSCVSGACKTNFPSSCGGNYCEGLPCGSMCPCAGDTCDPIAYFCDGKGTCQGGVPECSTGEMCSTAKDCGTPPPICVPCDGGTCAGLDCIKGKCTFACPALQPSPSCKYAEECPVLGEICQPCPNGTCAVQACLQNSCTLVCPF